MDVDLVQSGLGKLESAERANVLRYVAAIYRCGAGCHYDPAAVTRGLGRLDPNEREAVIEYYCDLCEVLEWAQERGPEPANERVETFSTLLSGGR